MLRGCVIVLAALACSRAAAHRHVAQTRKHTLFDQQRVQFFSQRQALHHDQAVEDPIEQQPRAVIQLHAFGRMADRTAQRLRAERYPLTVECGRGGQYAEALAQQVQHQIGARLLPRSDGMQHRAFVHHRLVDQAQIAEVDHRDSRRGRARQRRKQHRLADTRQSCFHHLHEARHQIVPVQTHDPQRLHVIDRAAAGAGAGAVGESEQFFLELDHRVDEAALQLFAEQRQRTLERATHPTRQASRGQCPWRDVILRIGG